MTSRTMAVRFAVMMVSFGSLTFAQDTRSSHQTPDSHGYVRKGADVPRFVVVRTFFNTAFLCYTGAGWSRLREELGIEVDSAAERSLLKAIFLAKAIDTDVLDLLPYQSAPPEVFNAVQLTAVRKRVHALRRVFTNLRTEFQKAGVSFEPLERMLEERVRPAIQMASFPGPDLDFFRVMREFDAEVDAEPFF